MISFPVSSVIQWNISRNRDHDRLSYMRIGQDFFNYFKCHQVTHNESRIFLDKLYESDGETAMKMIEKITDYNNLK